ncbi:hypothetical protein [Nocardia abscessus]|uniref:hypothetical protein n=1 Tax=Nocardia abscessus TaxID=120957 RepID=UPI001C3F3A7A|nr:hypothetical protein [Nocardia abscessus]MCC3331973.1 hypothetical protein [Nocardia abscessus]
MNDGGVPARQSETGATRGDFRPDERHVHTPASAHTPAAPRTGAPRARELPGRLWKHSRPSRVDAPNGDAPLRMTVRDVLNYFAKCPDCGYPAQASATVRELRDGRVETEVRPSCGLPCGWQGSPQISMSGTGSASARQ